MLGYIGEDDSGAWASFTLAGRLLRRLGGLSNPSLVSASEKYWYFVTRVGVVDGEGNGQLHDIGPTLHVFVALGWAVRCEVS